MKLLKLIFGIIMFIVLIPPLVLILLKTMFFWSWEHTQVEGEGWFDVLFGFVGVEE